MERFNVVDDGDLIFVFANKVEIRVYSLVLRLNSSVIRAMLGPTWSEGQAFAGSTGSSPGRLLLPDDDHEAMKLLCLVLHSRNDKLAHFLGPCELRAFAIVADKYDCLMAVKLAAEFWLSRMDFLSLDTPAQRSVLYAVYLFDNAKYFSDFTEKMAGHHLHRLDLADPQKTNREDHIMTAVLATHRMHYDGLCEKITAVVEDFSDFLSAEFDHLPGCTPGVRLEKETTELCDYDLKMISMHQQALARASLWTRNCRPKGLAMLVAKIASFTPPESNLDWEYNCPPHHYRVRDWYHDGYPVGIEELKEQAKAVKLSMCLDCYKAGGKFEGTCRVPH